MAKKNSKSGGNTPHIKGDEFAQELNQLILDMFMDIASISNQDFKPVGKYKKGEDIQMSLYANEHIQASFEAKVNNYEDRRGLHAVYDAESQAQRQARDKEQTYHLPYSLDAVAIVRADGKKPLAVVDLLTLIKLYKDKAFYKHAFINKDESIGIT